MKNKSPQNDISKLETTIFQIYENSFKETVKELRIEIQENEIKVIRDLHKQVAKIMVSSPTYEIFREKYKRERVQDSFIKKFLEVASSSDSSDFFIRYTLGLLDGSEVFYQEHVKPSYVT